MYCYHLPVCILYAFLTPIEGFRFLWKYKYKFSYPWPCIYHSLHLFFNKRYRLVLCTMQCAFLLQIVWCMQVWTGRWSCSEFYSFIFLFSWMYFSLEMFRPVLLTVSEQRTVEGLVSSFFLFLNIAQKFII